MVEHFQIQIRFRIRQRIYKNHFVLFVLEKKILIHRMFLIKHNLLCAVHAKMNLHI